MTRKRKTTHPTNEDMVLDIMRHSQYGAMAQLFVIDALSKWSEKIAELDPVTVDTGLISGAAWVGVAIEIRDKLNSHYNRRITPEKKPTLKVVE